MTSAMIVNETGATSNPGCRAVSRGLDDLLIRVGLERAASLPLGFWAEAYREFTPQKTHRLVKSPGRFTYGNPTPAPLDMNAWTLRAKDPPAALLRLLDEVQWVVVNAEGSMHHNLPRALALAGIIRVAAAAGKRVALLNATLQGMSRSLLGLLCKDVSIVHLRESRSFDEARRLLPHAFVAPDIATPVIDQINVVSGRSRIAMQECMITAGVLATPNLLQALIQTVRALDLRPYYLLIGDGNESDVAQHVCTRSGVEIMDAGKIDLPEIALRLQQTGFAVSGRHHINLFLLRLGVPFVAIPSNTWKIEATLADAGAPFNVALCHEDIPSELRRLTLDRDFFSREATDAFRRLVSKTNLLAMRFKACM